MPTSKVVSRFLHDKRVQSLVLTCALVAAIGAGTARYFTNGEDNVADEYLNEIDQYQQLPLDVQLEIQAIKELHNLLDDDKNGQVDSEESEEFVREELSMNQPSEKCETFHRGETLVSNEELWSKWQTSKAHNWSCDQVVQWLKNVVEAPELVPVFMKLHITGQFLPLIATNSAQFLNSLSISKHQKTKLQIKAMDVVLFGPPKSSLDSTWKDAVMMSMIVSSVLGLVYAWRKQSSARNKIDNFLEEIRDYELELRTLREKLNSKPDSNDEEHYELPDSKEDAGVEPTPALVKSSSLSSEEDSNEVCKPELPIVTNHTSKPRGFSHSSCMSEPVDLLLRDRSYATDEVNEIEVLRLKVWELECQLENSANNRIALKSLLQESCYSEWSHLENLRKKAEEEVVSAQKTCDKIKHKRTSVIGAFRLANSSTLEDAGLQITRAVNKMHKIAEQFQSYHSRWKRIEKISHLPLSISQPSSSSSLNAFSSNSSLLPKPISLDSSPSSKWSGNFRPELESSLTNIIRSTNSCSDIGSSDRQVGVAVDVAMETNTWRIGPSFETMEMIQEEEGSGAKQNTGSDNIDQQSCTKSESSVISATTSSTSEPDFVATASRITVAGSETESESNLSSCSELTDSTTSDINTSGSHETRRTNFIKHHTISSDRCLSPQDTATSTTTGPSSPRGSSLLKMKSSSVDVVAKRRSRLNGFKKTFKFKYT